MGMHTIQELALIELGIILRMLGTIYNMKLSKMGGMYGRQY